MRSSATVKGVTPVPGLGTRLTADQIWFEFAIRQSEIVYFASGTGPRSPPWTAAKIAPARAPQVPIVGGSVVTGLGATVVETTGAEVVDGVVVDAMVALLVVVVGRCLRRVVVDVCGLVVALDDPESHAASPTTAIRASGTMRRTCSMLTSMAHDPLRGSSITDIASGRFFPSTRISPSPSNSPTPPTRSPWLDFGPRTCASIASRTGPM